MTGKIQNLNDDVSLIHSAFNFCLIKTVSVKDLWDDLDNDTLYSYTFEKKFQKKSTVLNMYKTSIFHNNNNNNNNNGNAEKLVKKLVQ